MNTRKKIGTAMFIAGRLVQVGAFVYFTIRYENLLRENEWMKFIMRDSAWKLKVYGNDEEIRLGVANELLENGKDSKNHT